MYEVDGEDGVGVELGVINNEGMVMGDGFGEGRYLGDGMEELVDEGDVLSYVGVFYEVSEGIGMLGDEFGYDLFKVGEEGDVMVREF